MLDFCSLLCHNIHLNPIAASDLFVCLVAVVVVVVVVGGGWGGAIMEEQWTLAGSVVC